MYINFIMFILIYRKVNVQANWYLLFLSGPSTLKKMSSACIVNFLKNICSIAILFKWKPVTMTSCVVLSGNVVSRSLSASQSDLNVSLKNITKALLLRLDFKIATVCNNISSMIFWLMVLRQKHTTFAIEAHREFCRKNYLACYKRQNVKHTFLHVNNSLSEMKHLTSL